MNWWLDFVQNLIFPFSKQVWSLKMFLLIPKNVFCWCLRHFQTSQTSHKWRRINPPHFSQSPTSPEAWLQRAHPRSAPETLGPLGPSRGSTAIGGSSFFLGLDSSFKGKNELLNGKWWVIDWCESRPPKNWNLVWYIGSVKMLRIHVGGI